MDRSKYYMSKPTVVIHREGEMTSIHEILQPVQRIVIKTLRKKPCLVSWSDVSPMMGAVRIGWRVPGTLWFLLVVKICIPIDFVMFNS